MSLSIATERTKTERQSLGTQLCRRYSLHNGNAGKSQTTFR
jgi:hypothetical protein